MFTWQSFAIQSIIFFCFHSSFNTTDKSLKGVNYLFLAGWELSNNKVVTLKEQYITNVVSDIDNKKDLMALLLDFPIVQSCKKLPS